MYVSIAWSVVAVVVLVVLLGFRMDREYQRGVIFRLGRFRSVRGPGLYWVIPFVDQKVGIEQNTTTIILLPSDFVWLAKALTRKLDEPAPD